MNLATIDVHLVPSCTDKGSEFAAALPVNDFCSDRG